MANRYVYTGGSNTSPYNSWATAATTLTAGLTGATTSDVIYVAHDHAESTAAPITLASPSSALPYQVLCVNRAGSVPPVSADLRTTGTITTTGTSGISFTGWFYIYGLSFIAGSGASTTASITLGAGTSCMILSNCKLRLASTGAISRIQVTSSTVFNVLENTTMQFSSTSQATDLRGTFIWRKTPSAAVVAGTVPTALFSPGGTGNYHLEGLDFSNIAGSMFSSTSGPSYVTVKDCRWNVVVPIPNTNALFITVVNCDSTDKNTTNQRNHHNGAETTETTIVRTGGASDGTTPVSRKIVTPSGVIWRYPFEGSPIAVWNETVGSAVTVTVECIASAVLNNDDVWIDVEYLGTSGVPLGLFATTTKADVLATGVANTSSSATWGGALTGKFKLAATITPQEKGWIYIYPRVGKASTTVYVDPEITVT